MKRKGIIALVMTVFFTLVSFFLFASVEESRKLAAIKSFKIAPSFFIPNFLRSTSKNKSKKIVLTTHRATVAFIQTNVGRVLFTQSGAYICVRKNEGMKKDIPHFLENREGFFRADEFTHRELSSLVVMKCGFGTKGESKSRILNKININLDEPTGSYVNYLIGKKKNWKRNIPTYRKLIYSNVWKGIDVSFVGYMDRLEFRIMIKPSADPGQLVMETGATSLITNDDGSMIANLQGAELRFSAPVAWQEINGKRVSVDVDFEPIEDGNYGFTVGDYDKNYPLIIDPTLVWFSYIGGSGSGADGAYGIAVDNNGASYITGYSCSLNFPTTLGVIDESYNGGADIFVTKISSDGSSVVYSTFIGGTDDEIGKSIAIDSSGAAYITGFTHSSDFPTTSGAYQTAYKGSYDAFILKLSEDGSSLNYSSYLGGTGAEWAYGIAIDSSNAVYIAGSTDANDFPTTSGAFNEASNGDRDAFVSKISSDGSQLLYSTYLGGADSDEGLSIDVDSNGEAYITGSTSSSNFSTTTGVWDRTFNSDKDVFVTKLSSDGSSLQYSTYLGGSNYDYCNSIIIDSAGAAYLAGGTDSVDFPTTSGAWDQTYNNQETFVTKLSPDGSSLVYSTYLGGSSSDYCYDLAIDSAGAAYVTGYTNSSDFPITAGAWNDSNNGGISEIFITKFSVNGSSLVYSTYLGGSGYECARSIALDASGAAYITGYTSSRDFPTTNGAFSEHYHGGYDAFITKLSTNGSSLNYSTYLGGSGEDRGSSIAVGEDGTIYVTGKSGSQDFPTTVGTWSEDLNNNSDVVVSALSPDVSSLIYSTYIGGNGEDGANGIAVDSNGSAYVVGKTYSSDFPTTPGAYDTVYNGNCDGFITMLSPDGSSLSYSTFLGGTDADYANGIALTSNDSLYVIGYTESSNFPTTVGACYANYNGGGDVFVSRLSSDGASVEYSTFFGGSAVDQGLGIALGEDGTIYFTGYTSSSDFPKTYGAVDSSLGGSTDAFYAKISPDGSTLERSSFLGGSINEKGYGIAVNSDGSAYITGYTSSSDFPVTSGSWDNNYDSYEAFVSKFSRDGTSLDYSTFLGGSDLDFGYGIKVDSIGQAYVTGYTTSHDFPIAGDGWKYFNGGDDVFIAKISSNGSALLFSSFIGGDYGDFGYGIDFAPGGAVYIVGTTYSDNFPATAGAFDESYNGDYDIFVSELVISAGRFYYPRMSFTPGQWTDGYAVVNTNDLLPCDLWFTAYDAAGNMIDLSQVYIMDGLTQVAYQVDGIFGLSKATDGWVEADFGNVGTFRMIGYFLTQQFNSGLTGLDGSAVFYGTLNEGIIPRIVARGSYNTEVFIANPSNSYATVTLTGYDGSTSFSGGSLVIAPKGFRKFDVASQFGVSFNGYMKISSTGGIIGNAIISHGDNSISSMNILPMDSASETLYAAHITYMPNIYYTELNLINTSGSTATVKLTPYSADGSAMASAFNVEVGANQIKTLLNTELGLPSGENSDGWLKIEGNGHPLIGCLTFGNPVDNHYESSLPLQSEAWADVGFAQVATGNVGGVDFFTGIAIVNPNDTSTDVTIQILSSDGSILSQVTRMLGPHEKYVRLIDQIEGIGILPPMSSGIMHVSATQGIFTFELFGDNVLNFLSAVPAERVTTAN